MSSAGPEKADMNGPVVGNPIFIATGYEIVELCKTNETYPTLFGANAAESIRTDSFVPIRNLFVGVRPKKVSAFSKLVVPR